MSCELRHLVDLKQMAALSLGFPLLIVSLKSARRRTCLKLPSFRILATPADVTKRVTDRGMI